MKIQRLLLVLFVAAAVLGCVSPPPPPAPPPPAPVAPPPPPRPPAPPPEPPPSEVALTPAILERLENMQDYTSIRNYQFVLSSQITLIIASAIPNDHSLPGGRAVFENIIVRGRITFPIKSLGQVIDKDNETGDEIFLRVCFEAQEDEDKYPAETYNLVFSAKKSEKNEYFLLNYSPRPDTFLFSEERGTLRYGANTYTLMANEEIPYLLLRLEQKTNANEERRSPRGRSLNTRQQ